MAEDLLGPAATTNEGEASNPNTEGTAPVTPPAADGGKADEGKPPAGETPKEEKPGDTKPDGAPEKYELKPKEGEEFGPGFLEAFEKTARELNLSNEAAQKLVDEMAPVIQKQQQDQIAAVQAGWVDASKADKEFGGDKLKENLGVAKKALEQFGSKELGEMLTSSGLGSHPEVIRLLYRVGKHLTEDTFVGGKESKPAGNDFAAKAKKLYS